MKAIFILSLLLVGCSSSSRWESSAIKTGDAKFDSKLLKYVALDQYNELDIEWLQIDHETKVHIGVHSFRITPDEKGDVWLNLKTESIQKKYPLTLLEGGQKAYFTKEDGENFTQILQKSSKAEITLGEYRSVISLSEKPMNKLQKKPISFLPNTLIGIAL